MPGFEEVIKMIYRLYRKRHNQTASFCPDEETLACFCEGKLSKTESKRVQEHLPACNRCADVIALFYQKLEQDIEVPEFLIQRAKSLLKQTPLSNIFEVVLALKEKAMQILGTTGDVIVDNEIIPLPVLRSRQISEFAEEIKLIKELENTKITIHIQKKDKDKIRINLGFVDKTNLRPLTDLRLALFKDESELESYEVTTGSAVFDEVGFGRYDIQINRKDEKLGVIRLEIK